MLGGRILWRGKAYLLLLDLGKGCRRQKDNCWFRMLLRFLGKERSFCLIALISSGFGLRLKGLGELGNRSCSESMEGVKALLSAAGE